MKIKCDGLWEGDDNTTCEAPIVLVCCCQRCNVVDDEAFHACADPAHKSLATMRHERVYGRAVQWARTR